MKLPLSHLSLAVLAMSLSIASSLGAQAPRVRTREAVPAVASRIDTATSSPSRVVVRPPRTFVAYDTSNALRRRALDQNVTVNNRTVTRREFLRQASLLEAQLNAQGLSLRTRYPGDSLRVNDVRADAERLNAQRTALIAKKRGPLVRPTLLQRQQRLDVNPVLSTSTVLQLRSIDPRFSAALQRRFLPPLKFDAFGAPTLSLPVVKSYSDDAEVGDRDILAAGYGYTAKLTGDTVRTKLEITGEVDAWIFDGHGNIADVEANADAPNIGTGSAHAEINVLGQRVWSKDLSAGQTAIEGEVAKSVDYSAQTTILIYGIPVTVRVGGRGTVGLSYGLTAQAAAVTADLTPSVSLAGYAEAAVSIWVAEAGAGASLTLINVSLPMDAKLALVNEIEAGVWGIQRQFRMGYDVRALDGSVYAFVSVSHPCLPDFWNTCRSRYSEELFGWDGLRDSGTWVDHNDFIDLLAGTITAPRAIAATYSPRPAVDAVSTLTFIVTDAASGAALNATVTVAGQTVQSGQPVTATFCSRLTFVWTGPSWMNLPTTTKVMCKPATISVPGYPDKLIFLRP